MKNLLRIFASCVLLFAFSCKKGEKNANTAPDTFISIESINLYGEDRLNSTVYLSWFGTDNDGYVSYYELSFDASTWERVDKQDSTFRFSIAEGSDTTDIDFYIRSVDNDGNVDPDPAYLKIPIRNTPPEIEFDEDVLPNDSELVVMTFRWKASDADGDETLKEAFLKINEGEWVPIDRNKNLVTIVPENPDVTGPSSSFIYYDNENDPASEKVEGLLVNDINYVYLKITDIAGSESEVDTSEAVFIKPKTSDLLVIQGLPDVAGVVYADALNNQGITYDWIDYEKDAGALQPKFWEPTFKLLVNSYDRILLFSNESLFTNPVTTIDGMILDFAAASLENYLNNGGKMMISTAFAQNTDFTNVIGVLPMDSVPTTGGQVRISQDSTVFPLVSGYPTLQPVNIVLGVDPFYPSSDAERFYDGQVTKLQGWEGPELLAARRSHSSGNINQVFFSIQLHEFNADLNQLETLLKQILVDDFNW